MRTSSKSSFWAVAVLLSGAAAFGSACGGSGSDTRSAGGSGNATSGGSTSTSGGSTGIAGTSSTGGGTGGSTATTCDSSAMCCPTTSCACPYPQGDGTADAIANSEDGKITFVTATVAKALGHWDFSRDASMGTVTPTGNATLATVDGGANSTTKAMHVSGMNLTGWGAALAAEVSNGCPFDASKYGGISFWAKGTSTVAEGANKLLVLVGNPEYLPKPAGFCDGAAVPADPNCYARHRVTIDLTPDWKQYTVAWTDLQAPTYLMTGKPFGSNRITDIVFNASGPAPMTTPAASFDFWVDELQFVPAGTKGNVGGGSGGAPAGGTGAGGASGGTGGAAAGTGGAAAGNGGMGG